MALHGSDVHKVQLHFSSEAIESLDDFQREIDVSSRADAIRYALKVAKWIVDELGKGNKLYLGTPEKDVKEVLIPFLSPNQSRRKSSVTHQPENSVVNG